MSKICLKYLKKSKFCLKVSKSVYKCLNQQKKLSPSGEKQQKTVQTFLDALNTFKTVFFSYFFTKKMEVTVVFLYFLSQRFSRHFQTFLDTISRVIRLFQIKFRNIQTALDRLLCILDIFRCIQILQIERQPVTPFIFRLLFLQLFF